MAPLAESIRGKVGTVGAVFIIIGAAMMWGWGGVFLAAGVFLVAITLAEDIEDAIRSNR